MHEKTKIRQLAETIAVAALLAIFVRSFVVEAFTIPSASMEPTLLVGDYLLANRLSYVVKVPFTDHVLFHLGEPKRGDIVIFRYPLDPSKDYVKRIIAKGGDTVEIRDKVVYVNGVRAEEGYARFTDHMNIPGSRQPRDNFSPVKVPKDCYFAMGDNRDNSSDSRFWGFLKAGDLVGKAEIIYFSLDNDAASLFASVRWQRLGHVVR